MKRSIVLTTAFMVLFLCSCRKNETVKEQTPDLQTETKDTVATEPSDKDSIEPTKTIESPDSTERKITAEMAYEGVNKYCHDTYDWSVAEDNPSIMYVTMGEETDTEYQVTFRSYTGAFVYFHVDKKSGTTRIVEHVPSLDVEEEAGTIDLFEYLEKK